MRVRPPALALRLRVALLAAAAGSALPGCEPHAPAAPPPAAPTPRPAPDPPRPRTPLALPDELLLAARWRQPTALLAQLQKWSRGDLTLELFLRGRVGRPSRPIDLEAPLELFALWDGKAEPPVLRWAVSFALVPNPAAPAPRGPVDVESPIGLSCAEDAALGPVALRMVCSSSDDELTQLLPLATRALPLAELGAEDVAVQLRARPLRGVADEQLDARVSAVITDLLGVDALNRRGTAELAGLTQTFRDELRNLAEDLDGVSLGLNAREEALELSLLAPRATARSELLQLLIGTGAAGIAPGEFWDLHQESEHAGYLWAWSAQPRARLRAPIGSLLGALLDFRGLPDRLTLQGQHLIERLPVPLGPIVYASGRLPASAGGRAAPAPWLAALGWEAYGFAGRFAEYEAWAEQLVSALNDPILGPQFGRLLRSAWGERWVPQQIERRKLAGRGLGRGSFALELRFAAEPEADAPRAGRERPRPPTLFIVCVPEPDGVKLAWGADEKFLTGLLAAPARKASAGTLAERGGLGALHEQRTLAGGFSSLVAVAGDGTGAQVFGEQAAAALEGTPHRGRSPILYALSQRTDVPAVAFSARLGRDTLEDLLFLIANTPPQP
jgi:hypothetical protein